MISPDQSSTAALGSVVGLPPAEGCSDAETGADRAWLSLIYFRNLSMRRQPKSRKNMGLSNATGPVYVPKHKNC